MREGDDVNSKLYDYDLPEHIIMINDFAHVISSAWTAEYLYSNGYNMHRAILINGLGVQTFNDSIRDMKIKTPIAKFNVETSKRYRFRLIDIGVYSCTMKFSIDGHNLTVIALDGHPIEPIEVESIVILPGERYDFVLQTKPDSQSYFIKVTGIGHLCPYDKLYQLAELKYDKSTNVLDLDSQSYSSTKILGKVYFWLLKHI